VPSAARNARCRCKAPTGNQTNRWATVPTAAGTFSSPRPILRLAGHGSSPGRLQTIVGTAGRVCRRRAAWRRRWSGSSTRGGQESNRSGSVRRVRKRCGRCRRRGCARMGGGNATSRNVPAAPTADGPLAPPNQAQNNS
jgi:hypothetical protein